MKPSLIFRMFFMAALVLVNSGVGAAMSVRAANPSSDIVEFGGNATLGGDIAGTWRCHVGVEQRQFCHTL